LVSGLTRLLNFQSLVNVTEFHPDFKNVRQHDARLDFISSAKLGEKIFLCWVTQELSYFYRTVIQTQENTHLIMRTVITMLLLAVSAWAFAQDRGCASMEVLAQQLQQDPDMAARMEAIERQTQQFQYDHDQEGNNRVVITIPVVFHIIHNGDALGTNENLSDALIQVQLNQLNLDFSLTNPEVGQIPTLFQPVAANTEIQFCLAKRKPDGTATNGINRVNGGQASWTINQINSTLKPSTIWDRNQYLNIWSVVFGGTDGSVLGFAQFPGGLPVTDGVVVKYSSIGSVASPNPTGGNYARGRTATHEIGHWLNLRHIWGDATCGNDQVSDTPIHNTSNGGCPAYPHLSTCSGTPVEMTMNYMDYTYDVCMYMFSAGQKSRMQSVLNSGGARAGLTTSQGCGTSGSGIIAGSCGTPSGLTAISINTNAITLGWAVISGATAYDMRFRQAGAAAWTTIVVTGASGGATGLTANTNYEFQVQVTCNNTLSSFSALANFTTSSVPVSCTENYEPNNTRGISLPLTPMGQDRTARIATSGDNDWYRFANTSAQRNIRVDLTNLPANFDLKLYENASLRKTSQNSGTVSETITYNSSTVASNWYAYVYGNNGANHNTQCYTLRITLSSSAFRTDGSTDGETSEVEIPVHVLESGFAMFPNPATDELTLDVNMDVERQVKVRIIEITGRTISLNDYDLHKDQNRITMDVSALPSGLYVVQVENDKTVGSQKLTITRP